MRNIVLLCLLILISSNAIDLLRGNKNSKKKSISQIACSPSLPCPVDTPICVENICQAASAALAVDGDDDNDTVDYTAVGLDLDRDGDGDDGEVLVEDDHVMTGHPGCRAAQLLRYLYIEFIRGEFCFMNGAFVIEDRGGLLYDFLIRNCGPPHIREIQRSHDQFKKTSKINARASVGGNCATYVPMVQAGIGRGAGLKPEQQHQEYEFDPVTYLCGPELPPEPKEVILFYSFEVDTRTTVASAERTRVRYLYLKSESHGTSGMWEKLSHVGSLISKTWRNYRQTPNPSERLGQFQEDALKYPLDRQLINRQYSLYIEKNLDVEPLLFYNRCVRGQNEFFVSQEMNSHLLAILPTLHDDFGNDVPVVPPPAIVV